jgi:hypothetical protein
MSCRDKGCPTSVVYWDQMNNRTSHEIRELLEANLEALAALAQLQKRKLKSLNDTRALLYVALRELIVANDNETTHA